MYTYLMKYAIVTLQLTDIQGRKGSCILPFLIRPIGILM